MSNQNQNTSQEIDLRFLWHKFTELFDKTGFLIYRFFRFVQRNIIVVVILIIAGVALGYFLDSKTPKMYKHQIILALNFDSSSFLYSKIKHLNKKEFPDIKNVEIEPIIDVFGLISEKWEYQKAVELMSENSIKIHQYKEGSQIIKLYRYHTLTLTSDTEDINGSVVNDFLDKINQEPYYLNRKKIEDDNIAKEIQELEKSVTDLNKIFENLGNSTPVGSNGIKIETQAQTNDLLDNKKKIIDKINKLKIIQSEQSKTFYDLTKITNIKKKPTSYVLIFPIVFVLLFTALAFSKKLYNRYSSISSVKS